MPRLACSLCRVVRTLAHSWLSSGSPSRRWLRKLGVRGADEEVSGLWVEAWGGCGVTELGVEQGDDAGVLLGVNELF